MATLFLAQQVVCCGEGLCVVVVVCCFDVIGDLCDCIAGFPEFEIDGLAVMLAVVF